MAVTTVIDLDTLKAALTARSEEIHITKAITFTEPILLDYSVRLIGDEAPAETNVGVVTLTGQFQIKTAPNTPPIEVGIEDLSLSSNSTDGSPAILVEGENAVVRFTRLHLVAKTTSTNVPVSGIKCTKQATLYLDHCSMISDSYGIQVVGCKIEERMTHSTVIANKTHVFQASSEQTQGFWSNSDILIEDSQLTSEPETFVNPIDTYRQGVVSIEPKYNHCSLAIRRTAFATTEAPSHIFPLYLESFGNLVSLEQCVFKIGAGKANGPIGAIAVGSPLADTEVGADNAKSTISMNQCIFEKPENATIVVSNYDPYQYADRVFVISDSTPVPGTDRMYMCLIGKSDATTQYRWTNIQDALNATGHAEQTWVHVVDPTYDFSGLMVNRARRVYLSSDSTSITLKGYTTVTGKAVLLLQNNVVVPKEKTTRLIVDPLSSIDTNVGAKLTVQDVVIPLPLRDFDSIFHPSTAPEIGTVGSSNAGDPYNNATLKEMFDKLGDRIFCIVLDNSIKIFIGYPSSVVKSVKDIQLVTSNGVDLMLVRQFSPTAEQKRRGVTYVTAHDTGLIQYVMYMDPGFETEGIDPLLIH